MQSIGYFLLVAATLGRNRQSMHGCGKRNRPQTDVIFLVAIVQHGIEVKVIDLRYSTDVARDPSLHVGLVFAHQTQQMPNLKGLAPVTDKQLAVFNDSPLMNAEPPQATDKGINGDLEH